mgnify:CR=1 FL=1
MILKSYIVEQNTAILNDYQATLLYGENSGLKEDIKLKIKDQNKKAEIFFFFEEEILKNKNILYENFANDSLFSEEKIFFLEQATDKILEQILEVLEKKNEKIKIYIFSEILDKKSKLRNLFEKDKRVAIFACYEDTEKTLINYIVKELAGFKGLTGEIINLIITNSGSNRKVIQNEIVKIKVFFFNKLINKNQIIEILNIKNDSGFEEIRDTALIGKKDKINKLLSELNLLSEDSFFYLNSLNYRILKLIEIQKINETYKNYEQALESLKPPIFWKDKPIYLQQLKKWNMAKLNKAANKISIAEILMKKNSIVRNDIVIKDLIISLSEEASISF